MSRHRIDQLEELLNTERARSEAAEAQAAALGAALARWECEECHGTGVYVGCEACWKARKDGYGFNHFCSKDRFPCVVCDGAKIHPIAKTALTADVRALDPQEGEVK